MTDEPTRWDKEIEPGDVIHFEMDAEPITSPIDLIDPETVPSWPEPAEGGTLGGGADHDFMASDWIPFTLGALCSSIIWFIIFLAAKLLP